MANSYIVIKNSSEGSGKKFKVIQGGYRSVLQKNSSSKATIGGIKDRVEGAVYEVFQFTIKTSYQLTAAETSANYGTKDDLKAYYLLNDPDASPSNLLTLTDFLGTSYTGWLDGDFVPDPISTIIDGECAYFFINILFEVKDAVS